MADHVAQYSTRRQIYALGMGPETMQLLNLSEAPPPAGAGAAATPR